ncbi:MAG TPA: hypothetical protein PK186_09995 [candidate division Zixibacteria bacterium]|nr:hypothetical protein [candidate division Zixibacteria bacterium]MDD4916635.1 hypothetical protein [candidate division Zixibacteria bacterium]MDM7973421.1 hypothetical protein [candidate division Zixibacteria bacterium]HOD67571.1 hypothetical protein [candidate division Zixibacteria bacterium]HPC11222.1 hypothetical protein [candidate division Zixibacteria bacterium]
MEWRVHPATRRPWLTAAVSLFILAVSFLVLVTTDSRWFSFFALVVLFASLAKFYFPTSYRMDGRGVTIKTTTQTLLKEWRLFRSYYPDRNGVLLSPFPQPSRLENFRGLYVLFGGNREDVVAFVSRHVGAAAPAGDKEATP